MNLYRIIVQHFSQKDSHTSTQAYLAANNDEEVYEWIKAEKLEGMYVGWNYNEEDGNTFDIYNDDYSVTGTETFREKMLRIKGEFNDEDLELSDLYYGKTIYGWEEMGPIDERQLKVGKQLQIVLEA